MFFRENIAISNLDSWITLKPFSLKYQHFAHLVETDFQVSNAIPSYRGRLLMGRPSYIYIKRSNHLKTREAPIGYVPFYREAIKCILFSNDLKTKTNKN